MQLIARKISLQYFIVYVLAFIWMIMTLYPLLFTLLSSLKQNEEIFGNPFALPRIFHFEYYFYALEKANMLRAILNSLFMTSIATFLAVMLSAMVSFAITRFNVRYTKYVYLFFVMGLMIPVQSILIPLVRLISSLHANNSYTVMIILYTTFSLSLCIFLITGFMKGISKELDEAAVMDGCGPFVLLIKILLPISSPILATAAIITFLFTYNDLLFSVLFITDKQMYTISLALMSFVGNRSTDYGPTFASIVLSIIPMVIIYLLFQEKVEKGLSSGAVKG